MEMTDVNFNLKIIKSREKSCCMQNLIHKSCPEKRDAKKSHDPISSALTSRAHHQAEEKKLYFWASAELSYCFGVRPSRDPGGPVRAPGAHCASVESTSDIPTSPPHAICRNLGSWEKKWTWISLLLQLSCREINKILYLILIIFNV